jgi:hypothetical protein
LGQDSAKVRFRSGENVPVAELFNGAGVFTQIQLGADKNHRRLRCMMRYFGVPLQSDEVSESLDEVNGTGPLF